MAGFTNDVPTVPMNQQDVTNVLNNDPNLQRRYGITPDSQSQTPSPPQAGSGLGQSLQQYNSPSGQAYMAARSHMKHPQHMADGGPPSASAMAPWYTRREASDEDQVHQSGLFPGSTGGRTDVLNRLVPAGSYVVPADVVSGLGEGNTMAGSNILDKMMHSLPYGMSGAGGRRGGGSGIPRAPAAPRQSTATPASMVATGGSPKGADPTGHVPIIAASGEFLIHPDQVKALGGGDIKHGHRILDAFVVHVRKKTAKTMNKLPGPKGAKK